LGATSQPEHPLGRKFDALSKSCFVSIRDEYLPGLLVGIQVFQPRAERPALCQGIAQICNRFSRRPQ
jgi:hypothetical protein